MMKLRRLIELESQHIGKVFDRTEEVWTHFRVFPMNGGQPLIIPPPHPDEDLGIAMMREFFAANPTQRYLFIDEAWDLREPVADATEFAAHPNRREIVVFTGEDRDEGMMIGRRAIIRPKGGKPYLGPLELREVGLTEPGRLLWLLPRPPLQ